uniref:ATP-dependent DNA helicase n=1 Tax=Strigamia maritima TaxID=126957 RepID=T1IKL2_STRMM
MPAHAISPWQRELPDLSAQDEEEEDVFSDATDSSSIPAPASDWRREEHLRRSGDSAGKRVDVYYYPTAGRRLRSKLEVNNYCADVNIPFDEQRFIFQPIEKHEKFLQASEKFEVTQRRTHFTMREPQTYDEAIKANKLEVVSMALTGIAATLLSGGRTAHSRFKLPVPINETSTCNIKANSTEARELKNAKLIIWDEAVMAPNYAFATLDRSLTDYTTEPLNKLEAKLWFWAVTCAKFCLFYQEEPKRQ